jgi:hypothetical protein
MAPSNARPSLSITRINELWELLTGLYMLDAWEKTLFVRGGPTLATVLSCESAPCSRRSPRPAEQLPRHLSQRLHILLSNVVFARPVIARGCVCGEKGAREAVSKKPARARAPHPLQRQRSAAAGRALVARTTPAHTASGTRAAPARHPLVFPLFAPPCHAGHNFLLLLFFCALCAGMSRERLARKKLHIYFIPRLTRASKKQAGPRAPPCGPCSPLRGGDRGESAPFVYLYPWRFCSVWLSQSRPS